MLRRGATALRSSATAVAARGFCSLPRNALRLFTRNFIDLHKLGSKEAVEKERARLSDELSRGYFADISEMRKHGGKIAVANKTIISSVSAIRFPDLDVSFSDGRNTKLPIISDSSAESISNMPVPSTSLVCLSFRASSQAMVESWSNPFLNTFGDTNDIQVYEVSFLESWLFSVSPIKRLFLQIMKKSNNPKRQIVYSFGDHYDFRKKLQILNLLSGYVFLLDKMGRIRWQGFGSATDDELSSLLSCTSRLLEEK